MQLAEHKSAMRTRPMVQLLNFDLDHNNTLLKSDRVKVLNVNNIEHGIKEAKVLVFLAESHLVAASKIIHTLVKRNSLAALLIYFRSNQAWVLQESMAQAKVRTLKHTHVHNDNKVRQRVLRAWANGEQSSLIADASVDDTRLLIKLCSMDVITVPMSELKSLAKLNPREWSNLEVSQSGSHIYWPCADLHVDVEGLRSLADPEYRRKANQEKLIHDSAFGRAVAQLRTETKLTQVGISGISDRQIRRIESGESISAAAVANLARAHNMDTNEYMHRIARIIHSLNPDIAPAIPGTRK
jgi:hypothetical protein